MDNLTILLFLGSFLLLIISLALLLRAWKLDDEAELLLEVAVELNARARADYEESDRLLKKTRKLQDRAAEQLNIAEGIARLEEDLK